MRKRMKSIFRIHETNTIWREALHLGSRQMVPKGHIWHIDENQKTFSFLYRGSVHLGCITRSARERIVLVVGEGCIFREVGLILWAPQYATTIKANEACEVYHFPGDMLYDAEFVRQYPHLISNLLFSLGSKFGAAFAQLAEKTEPAPLAVVSNYLWQLADQHDTPTFAPGLSQVNLALALGLHRSTVCRILQLLRLRGIIGTFTRDRLEIFKPDQLRALCE